MTYRYYDNRTALVGAVRELAVARLGASEKDSIEFGEYTWNSGYCETCSYEEHDFVIFLNNDVVYDSQSGSYYGSPFQKLQNWLTGTEQI